MVQARVVADDSPAGYFTNYSIDYQPQCSDDVSVNITHATTYTRMFALFTIYRQLQLIQMTLISILSILVG